MNNSEQNSKEQEIQRNEAIGKIPMWLNRGYELIYPQRREEWIDCAISRAKDVYNGRDLEDALQVMQALEEGKMTMEEISQMINEQKHSGASYGMLIRIVTHFSKRGTEFYRFLNNNLSKNQETYLIQLEKKNKEFESTNKEESLGL